MYYDTNFGNIYTLLRSVENGIVFAYDLRNNNLESANCWDKEVILRGTDGHALEMNKEDIKMLRRFLKKNNREE